jgi:hypothetical protein
MVDGQEEPQEPATDRSGRVEVAAVDRAGGAYRSKAISTFAQIGYRKLSMTWLQSPGWSTS